MPNLSLGDMAQSVMLRRQNTQLSSELNQLAEELATGQTADPSRHLKGNFSYLSALERDRTMLESYGMAAAEAQTFTGAMQSVLNKVQETSGDLAADLLATGNEGLPEVVRAVSGKAGDAFGALVTMLNTSVAGQTLFAGARTDSAALAGADDMLAAIRGVVSGETGLSDILAAIDDWFAVPGGGFETDGYLGEQNGLKPFLLGENETVSLDLGADAPQLRNILKHTAIAALAADPALGFPAELQKSLLVHAGNGLVAAQNPLTGIRADLGYAEARVDEIATRIASEKTASEYAIGALLGVDPFETVTRLEEVQLQLESLYTATVRLGRLSLVGYMR
ncbi:hypothetical protein FLO80_10490 [Aquicoccus porphyridii]|uniref:Flagellin C-terminal domain-containing protein n=1 Tax=Aquicoccus porphyridii TaxID=1852029 RepID=A0A5A9ZGI4_9RHOB|nr:flagellin [Aquicoccus porphyridii]KAA0916146.1 hypothetical protein FLO80_10490 [Aquicoccus porphyridii]RAI52785.1 hypothetical protein DOO74_16700 [Rhodobacteraceae bacterium AsT-22]